MILVFGAAVIMRLVVASQIWDLPLSRTPKLDSGEYLAWARRMASGDWNWSVVSPHGPGYPVFLAAVLTTFSGSLHAALILQSILGAATAVMVAVLCKQLADWPAGIAAGLLYAVFAPAVWVETSLLAEGLQLSLIVLALTCISRPVAGAASATVAGVALGLATVVRPTSSLIVAALALALLVERPRRWKPALILIAASAVTVAPVAAKNYLAGGGLTIQGYGGLNFYIGNSPLHDGRPTFRLGGGWDALNSEPARLGVTDPVEQDRYYVSKTFKEIEANPLGFLKLMATKLTWLVQAEEVRDSHSFYFFTSQSSLLRVLPGMALLFPLACLGIAATRRRAMGVPGLILYAYAGGCALAVVLLVVGARYRLPLVPALAVLAGIGLIQTWDAVLARDLPLLLLSAVIAGVGVLVSHALSDPMNRNLAEEWAFTGSALVTERDLAGAEMAYRQALNLDPQSSMAWDGLGLVEFNSRRLSDARDAFLKSKKLNSENSRPLFHLGLIDELEGHSQLAVQGYEAALALSPHDPEIVRRLGGSLLQSGSAGEALPYLVEVVNRTQSDPDAHRALGRALASLNRTAQAENEFSRSVELAPANGEAWLDLCFIELELGQFEKASAALERAASSGASPERLTSASLAVKERRSATRR